MMFKLLKTDLRVFQDKVTFTYEISSKFLLQREPYVTAKCNKTYLFRKLCLVQRLQSIISIFTKYVSGYCFIPTIVKPLDVMVALFI